tara:strand:+ start:1302 stop:1547 length:246 start_codon:yes stop_codon:yes gene_type:complete
MKTDSWKRPVEKHIEDSIPQQLELHFTLPDATPEQIKAWHEQEGKWWADRSLSIVAIASVLQFCSIGFMLLSFYLLDIVFS